MSRSYRALRFAVRLFLRSFFRRIEVTGLENIPATGGGILVSWHPNALVDPALIFISFPRALAFGARHGILHWPIIGRLARAIGTVPIYRAQDLADPSDDQARRAANRMSLEAMAGTVAAGSFVALFPEGLSHDDPGPRELKPGASRVYYRALELDPENPPSLLPVGLHYERKARLGSRVLIVYHPPMALPTRLLREGGIDSEAARCELAELTLQIQESLKNVVYATDNWMTFRLLHRAGRLVRAARAAHAGKPRMAPSMAEQVLGFRRLWAGYNARRESHPREVQQLLQRIASYDAELRALGIEDHELDRAPSSRWLDRIQGQLLLKGILALVVLPPLAVCGYVVNLAPALLVWLVNRRRSRQDKDQATVKLLTGAIVFPLAWLTIAIVTAVGLTDSATGTLAPMLTGVAVFSYCLLSAILIMHYHRFARETLRAIRLHVRHSTHIRGMQKLRDDRESIFREVEALGRGLTLPGTLLPDGTLVDAALPE